MKKKKWKKKPIQNTRLHQQQHQHRSGTIHGWKTHNRDNIAGFAACTSLSTEIKIRYMKIAATTNTHCLWWMKKFGENGTHNTSMSTKNQRNQWTNGWTNGWTGGREEEEKKRIQTKTIRFSKERIKHNKKLSLCLAQEGKQTTKEIEWITAIVKQRKRNNINEEQEEEEEKKLSRERLAFKQA